MKIIEIVGRAFHLPGDNIDTDRIIPARYLRSASGTFEGLEAHVFEDDRRAQEGKHPFDLEANRKREILVVDANFGSGSSREHAPQALMQWGIKALMGKSFAAIFRGNCTANGVVCVDLSEEHHKLITDLIRGVEFQSNEFRIDLEKMKIAYADGRFLRDTLWSNTDIPCTMPVADREMFLAGTWDTMVTLLEAGDKIEKVAQRLQYLQHT